MECVCFCFGCGSEPQEGDVNSMTLDHRQVECLKIFNPIIGDLCIVHFIWYEWFSPQILRYSFNLHLFSGFWKVFFLPFPKSQVSYQQMKVQRKQDGSFRWKLPDPPSWRIRWEFSEAGVWWPHDRHDRIPMGRVRYIYLVIDPIKINHPCTIGINIPDSSHGSVMDFDE